MTKNLYQKNIRTGWTPNVIIERNERDISCSMRTLYRKFSSGKFDVETLPMQGKRKPNGHLEGDTIIGRHHNCAIIMLVERLTKCIIAIKPAGRQAPNIEVLLNQWLDQLTQNLFKFIIFNYGKEFSNWKIISNKQDINIYFADSGTPSQRGLTETTLLYTLDKNKDPKRVLFNYRSIITISQMNLC